MADEDALFAEFMGEIKSTVVEAAGDDGAASDTASVGDANADNDEGAGGKAKDAETNKRKGEVCGVHRMQSIHVVKQAPVAFPTLTTSCG